MNKLIKDKSLSEKAYDSLCEMISEMTPGHNRLPSEDELARTMGVSRATIREALKHLLMDGVITTIHGKGTFAHPSAFSAGNRLDLDRDFAVMLSKQFRQVNVEIDWLGNQSPSELCRRHFGPQVSSVLASGWTYRGDGKPALYGYYEIDPAYVLRQPDKDAASLASLPQFSTRYMQAPIDYCIMTARMRSSQTACKKLEVDSPYLLCWDEQIFDIDDNLVAVGTVYVHPTNIELSLVTRLEN